MVVSKICGINSQAALDAAVAGNAGYIGLVFYPRSPRAVSLEQAAALARATPDAVAKVGMFVDPDDATLERTLNVVALDFLQLHGNETPERVSAIKRKFAKRVIKACPIASAGDIEAAAAFVDVADRLLFDAREPSTPEALPGGNGIAFDWRLLGQRQWSLPWLLSGGLHAENLASAVAATGAAAVDVSSGVESSRGVKDPDRIKAFLAVAATL